MDAMGETGARGRVTGVTPSGKRRGRPAFLACPLDSPAARSLGL